jgi:hypothetical protein
VRRPHIKSGIGYKTGNQHNTRVNTKRSRIHQVHQGQCSTTEEAKHQDH